MQIDWAADNYDGWDYQQVLDRFVQSGEYPQEFIDWEREQDANP